MINDKRKIHKLVECSDDILKKLLDAREKHEREKKDQERKKEEEERKLRDWDSATLVEEGT